MARSMVFGVISIVLLAEETAWASPVPLARGANQHKAHHNAGLALGVVTADGGVTPERLEQGKAAQRAEAVRAASQHQGSLMRSEAASAAAAQKTLHSNKDNRTEDAAAPANGSSPALAVVSEHAHEESPKIIYPYATANEGALLELAEAVAQKSESEMLPSGADLLNKAQDITAGTSSIIQTDYPFACLCGADGVCEKDSMKTPCPMRPGSGSGATRAARPSEIAWLLLLTGSATNLVFSAAW